METWQNIKLMTEKEDELKGCPFCGRDKSSIETVIGYDNFNKNETYHIYCRGCGARQRENRNKALVIKKWNKRI